MTEFYAHDTVFANPTLRAMKEAALIAGSLISIASRQGMTECTTKSASCDLVTDTDVICEKAIIKHLLSLFPENRIISEEQNSDDDIVNAYREGKFFIIDAIDGTMNFVHGINHSAVSIGYTENGIFTCGVVYNPYRKEMFVAEKDHGAYLLEEITMENGGMTNTPPMPIQKLTASPCTQITDALLITEITYDRTEHGTRDTMNKLGRLIKANVRGVRMYASAALDLCQIAKGRADIYYEGVNTTYGPKIWDWAAGYVVASEAGVLVTDHDGNPFNILSGRILACCTSDLQTVVVPLLVNNGEEENGYATKNGHGKEVATTMN